MARPKVKVFSESGQRLNRLLTDYKMKQTHLAEITVVSRTTINQIINGRINLSDEIADEIVKAFPDEDPTLLHDWLMGRINYRNIRQQLQDAMDEVHTEGNLLSIGLMAFAELSGFTIEPKTQLDGSNSLDNFLHALNDGSILARNGQAVDLTPLQLNKLQNEICDYIEFTLDRIVTGKRSV